jgi:ABC-type amino acid transport system permease subunit
VDTFRISHHPVGHAGGDRAGQPARTALYAPAPFRWTRRKAIVSGWVSLFRNTPLLVQLLFWYFAAWNGLPQAFRDAVNADHSWSILPGDVWWFTPEFLCSAWGWAYLPRRF